jgi:hypothetical protein
MTFRSIGTLAGDVLRKAELRAARQATAAKGGGLTVEDSISPPIAPAPREKASEWNMASGKDGDPAQRSERGSQTIGRTALKQIGATNGHRMAPALRVIDGDRCMDRAFPTRLPRAARSIHLLLISSHSPTHDMRSGTA